MWPLKAHDSDAASRLVESLKIPPLLARVLSARGITTTEEAIRFLSPRLSHMNDPFTIPGMEKAALRLAKAVQNGETIVVHGDYDADGVSAAVLLTLFLRALGVKAEFYIPHRIDEGHGISLLVGDFLKRTGSHILVTVDCGIRNVEEVKALQDKGCEVIVTDHHLPGDELPPATAVADPLLAGSAYKGHLSGVGVAFMLVTALRRLLREKGWFRAEEEINLKSFLDLVAIGTVADVVPLTGDNRLFVKYGLKLMQTSPRPGIQALAEVAGLKYQQLNTWDIAFKLAPRINAAGRMLHAGQAAKLLMEEDYERAIAGARELHRLNAERQKAETEILREAEESVLSAVYEDHPVIVIASEGWNPGVLGIVAARIVEKYGKPCIAIGILDECGIGSARAPEGVNLVEILSAVSGLLISYGGHAAAAGLRIAPELIDDFRQQLLEVAAGINAVEKASRPVDAEAVPSELRTEIFQAFQYMEPYGEGNPRPLILTRGLRVLRAINLEGGHLKIFFAGAEKDIQGLIFGMADHYSWLAPGDIVDVVFTPAVDQWEDYISPYLKITELSPSK